MSTGSSLSGENPTPWLLVGRVIDATPFGALKIHWLFGPQGIQNKNTPLSWYYQNAYFGVLKAGDWFQGVVLEFPVGVYWLEPPAKCPDPTDAKIPKLVGYYSSRRGHDPVRTLKAK